MSNLQHIDEDVAVLRKSSALLYTEQNTNSNLLYLENRINNTNHIQFGNHTIEANGIDNNFPTNFKNLLDSAYIGHGVNRTLINLLLSGGVGTYTLVKIENKLNKDWVIDNEINDWLNSFDFHTKYLPEIATDMIYVENAWTEILLNKGARIGNPFIAALRPLGVEHMRLEAIYNRKPLKKAYYSDWLFSNLTHTDIEPIPFFQKNKPYAKTKSCFFSKMPTFGSNAYGRPPNISASSLLQILALLPNFHKANLTEKAFKWIVAVNNDYYQSVRDQNHWNENSKEFNNWKENFHQSIDTFLAAPDAGKVQTRLLTTFATHRQTFNAIDNIKITKLDDDTKMLAETGMNLHDTYTMGFVSASSIHPQLANVHLKNHALSGSNLREAYEMHIKTAVPTMRYLLLDAANTALKINFPHKKLHLGFMDVAFDDYNPVKSTEKK